MTAASTSLRPLLPLIPAWVFLFILPFTHTVALRLLALFTAFALGLWQWSRAREPRLSELPAWRWILFWALLPLVLVPFAVERAYSLGEIKTEIGYGMLALLVFFVGVRSERALRVSVYVLLAAFTIVATWIIAAYVYVGSWNQANYFGGQITYTTYLVTTVPLLLLVNRLRLFAATTPWVIAALAVLGLTAAFLAEQRGFWFAAFVQAAAALLIARRTQGPAISARFFWLLLASAAGVAALGVAVTVSARFGSDAAHANAVVQDLRIRNWTLVVDWIAQQPLTGYGFGRQAMSRAFPEQVSQLGMFWHAHNVVLNYAFQLGIPGVVAILGVFGALLANWLKLTRSEDPLLRAVGTAGALIVVGVLARNMTNDLFQRDLSLLFWALTGMLAGFAAERVRAPTRASA